MSFTVSRVTTFTGIILLIAGLAEAVPPGPPFTPPGPPPWISSQRVRSVPIPATTLILFGGGLLALHWLRSTRKK